MKKMLPFLTSLFILIAFLIWGNMANRLGLSMLMTIIGYVLLLIITTVIMTIIMVYIQKTKIKNEDNKCDQ